MASSTENPPRPSDAQNVFPTIRRIIGPRVPDATYDSDALLFTAYESHSYNRGYGVVLVDSKGLNRLNKLGRRVIYLCDR